jgi:hypothetical protein
MRGFRPVRYSGLVATLALISGGLGAVVGAAPAGATNAVAAAATTLPGYTALVPVRICDTRASGPGVAANQCDASGPSTLSTGGVLTVKVAGAAGVPADATAVVLHVTATTTSEASYLTVWPTGQAQPLAANMNWAPGQTVPNLVQTGVGTGGSISVFNHAGTVDVVVDLQGYFRPSTGALFVPVSPARACDTRAGQPANQCNAQGTSAGTIGAGQARVVNLVNDFGVPAGATAVAVNVTATTTSAASYLTLWPDGAAMPFAASLNWAAGQTISNRVVATLGPAGTIDVFNAYGSTDVVIDVGGYFTTTGAGSGYFPTAPTRICDTRPVGPGVAANGCNGPGGGTLASGEVFSLSGFNPMMTAVVANTTVTNTGAAGFLTVFPDDSPTIPLAADLTWAATQTIGNLAVAKLGSTATMDFFNGSTGSTDVVLDAEGFYSATAPAAATARAAGSSPFTPTNGKRTAKPLG